MSKKILIIEDEPDIRKTIEYNLAREGFDIHSAASLEEGKSILDDYSCCWTFIIKCIFYLWVSNASWN